MTSQYTNYLVEFFKIIYETCKDHYGKITEVTISLKKVDHFGKDYIRIYVQIELFENCEEKFVNFFREKEYLSYRMKFDEETEFMEFHKKLQEVENDMNHIYYLMKYFMPDLKIKTINLREIVTNQN
jgi:hypothetical protein